MPIDYAAKFAAEAKDEDVPKQGFPLKPEVWVHARIEDAVQEMHGFAKPPFPIVGGKLRIIDSAVDTDRLSDSYGQKARGMEFFRIGLPAKTHEEYIRPAVFGPKAKDKQGNSIAGQPDPDAGKPTWRWGKEASEYHSATGAALVPKPEGKNGDERDADAKAKVSKILSSEPYITIARNAGEAVVQVDEVPVTDDLRAATGSMTAVAAALDGKEVLVKLRINRGLDKDGNVVNPKTAEKPRNEIARWMPATPENIAKYVTQAGAAPGATSDRF